MVMTDMSEICLALGTGISKSYSVPVPFKAYGEIWDSE